MAKGDQYQLRGQHYRKGRLLEPGTIITLEEGEKPGKTWIKVQTSGKSEAKPEAKGDAKGGQKAI